MTSVNEKSFAEPMPSLEDDLSPGMTGCSSAPPPAAQPEPARSADADTFETVPADPRRAELERINAERRKLRPELEKRQTEALRSLPKMLPLVGSVTDVACAIWDEGRALASRDVAGIGKAAGEAAKSIAETKLLNALGESVRGWVTGKAGEKAGELAARGVEGLAKLKDAYEVTDKMIEYGKVVRQDEEPRYRAQDRCSSTRTGSSSSSSSTARPSTARTASSSATSRGRRRRRRRTSTWPGCGVAMDSRVLSSPSTVYRQRLCSRVREPSSLSPYLRYMCRNWS